MGGNVDEDSKKQAQNHMETNFTKQTEGILKTTELLVRKKKESRLYQDISRKKRRRDKRPIQPQMRKKISL